MKSPHIYKITKKQRGILDADVRDLLLYASIILWTVAFSLEYSTLNEQYLSLNSLLRSMMYTSYVLLFFKMLLDMIESFDFRYIAIFAIAMVQYLSFSLCGSDFIYPAVILIAAGKNAKLDCMAWVLWVSIVVSILFVSLCSITGITNEIEYIKPTGGGHSMGFTHPNTFGALLTESALLFIFIFRYRIDWHVFIVLVIHFAVAYFVSGSLTSCITIAFAFILCFLLWIYREKIAYVSLISATLLKHLRTVLILAAVASMAIAIVGGSLSFLGDNPTASGRTELFKAYFEIYDILPFGQELQIGQDLYGFYTFTLDNAYLYLLLGFGWVNFIIVFATFFFVIKKAVTREDYATVIIVAAYAVQGLAETSMIRVGFSFLWLLILAEVWNLHGDSAENKTTIIGQDSSVMNFKETGLPS